MTQPSQLLSRYASRSLGWGLVITVMVPVVAFFGFVTVVGLPLSVLALLLLVIGFYLGQIVVALCMGNWVLRRSRPKIGDRPLTAFLVGASIHAALAATPIVGWAFMVGSSLAGLGATVLAIRDARGTVVRPS